MNSITSPLRIVCTAVVGLCCSLALAAGPARAEMTEADADRAATEARVEAGYRGLSVHGAPGRAAEFDSLEASPTWGARFFSDYGAFHLDLDAGARGDEDYSVTAALDTKGLVRLLFRSERFSHNLNHLPYANGGNGDVNNRVPGPLAEGSRPDANYAGRLVYYSDFDPNGTYGLRLDLNEVKARVKCPDYPAHFNIAYWRYEKEGEKQQRFFNHRGTTSCNGCHLQSTARPIDRVTEEVKASVDAHAGYVDMVVETLLRTFRDREATPVSGFRYQSQYRSLPHDETPDSSLKELTVRLNTAPAGGLVGSASFTMGQRENRSDLLSEGPIKAETDYRRGTADVTYTPNEHWTVSMRYRLLDMDSDNSEILTTYGYLPRTDFSNATATTNDNPLQVREALDITRAWYEAVVSYRPSRALTLKAELRREDVERDLGAAEAWELPEEENSTRLKLGFHSRLLDKAALKLSGWAALQRIDDPAYGTTAEESRELFVSANYTPAGRWGLAASLNALSERHDGRTVEQPDAALPGAVVDFDLARKLRQQKATFGGWLSPRDGVTLDLNYGYFRSAIDQDLLFGRDANSADATLDLTVEDEGSDYRQAVHTVAIGANWQPLQQVSCRLEGYHIRSKAYFSPEFYRDNLSYGGGTSAGSGISSSDELRAISKLKLRQNGIKGRVNWKIDDHLSCALEATFDDYDDLESDVFDGAVQSYMASLAYTF